MSATVSTTAAPPAAPPVPRNDALAPVFRIPIPQWWSYRVIFTKKSLEKIAKTRSDIQAVVQIAAAEAVERQYRVQYRAQFQESAMLVAGFQRFVSVLKAAEAAGIGKRCSQDAADSDQNHGGDDDDHDDNNSTPKMGCFPTGPPTAPTTPLPNPSRGMKRCHAVYDLENEAELQAAKENDERAPILHFRSPPTPVEPMTMVFRGIKLNPGPDRHSLKRRRGYDNEASPLVNH